MKSKIMSLLLGNRGGSPLKTIVIISIIGMVGYAGLKVGKPYYEWIRVKKEIKTMAVDFRNKPISQLRSALPKNLKKFSDAPRKAEPIIKRKGKKTTIIIDYDIHVIFIPEKLEHTFKFHVEESNL